MNMQLLQRASLLQQTQESCSSQAADCRWLLAVAAAVGLQIGLYRAEAVMGYRCITVTLVVK